VSRRPSPREELPRHVARPRQPDGGDQPLAREGTWRGLMWSAVIALGFVVLSYPRDLLPDFEASLGWLAALVAAVAMADVKNLRAPWIPVPVLLFLVLCGTSVVWSVSPDDTVRALVLYGGIAVFGCLVVSSTEISVLLRGISWGAVAVAALTLWAVLMGYAGAGGPVGEAPVLGYHGNRNIVSYSLVLGLAAVLAGRPTLRAGDGRSVWTLVRWGAPIPVIVVVLVLTRSGTGMVAAAALVCAALLMAVARRTRVFATATSKVVGLVVAALAVLLASTITQSVFEALGRRTDFSGRVPLWRAVVDVWQEAPLLGYGWGAIWPYSWFAPESLTEVKQQIDVEAQTSLSHGHNIVFDLLPQLGLVGVVLLAVLIGGAVAWLFVPLGEREYVVARWTSLGSLALVVNGVSEPMLSIPIGWFVLVTVSASSSRLRRDGALSRSR